VSVSCLPAFCIGAVVEIIVSEQVHQFISVNRPGTWANNCLLTVFDTYLSQVVAAHSVNQSIHCFIIDDEAPSRFLVEKFVKRVPYLTLVGQASNAIDALFAIEQVKPDLIFLDVEMPEMTGFEFLRALPNRPGFVRPAVIMITAYSEFALKGYEHDVLDYLLKPVLFERFMQAINRFVDRRNNTYVASPPPPAAFVETSLTMPTLPATPIEEEADGEPFILVKEDKKLIRIVPVDIIFAESLNDYLTIHLEGGRQVTTYSTVAKFEALLPKSQFLRVNRSYIIRIGAIKEIDGNLITTFDGKRVPIGVTYREHVMDVFTGRKR
jgi:two-component system, LytTR family, response regulator